ncbi:MAG: hypothetical protein V3T60_16510 [Candidatus Binatia bacterium]
MPVSVAVVWWISLFVALILTLVAWGLLNRVVQMAKKIEDHAKRTLPAAVNIVNHTAFIRLLQTTKSLVGEILSTAKSIDEAAASIERKVGK